MLALLISIFLALSIALMFGEIKSRRSSSPILSPRLWRRLSYFILMLVAPMAVGIHYWKIAPLATADRLELRGQYFPLTATIRISGDPAEADYYSPTLLVRGQEELVQENPLIEISSYNDRTTALQVSAKRMARPLRQNDRIVNVRPLSGENRIKIGELIMIYQRGLFSGRFVADGKKYEFEWPRRGGVVAVSELLCQAGLSLEAQRSAVSLPRSPSVSGGQLNSAQMPEDNPLDHVWLIREGWRSFGLINGSNTAVLVNDETLPSEFQFSLSSGDQLLYGIGNRAFKVKVRIEPADNRLYIFPEDPLSFPLYHPQDDSEDAEIKVFISSAPTTAEKAYQLALGERNRDLIKGVIQYSFSPSRIAKTGPEGTLKDRTQLASAYDDGFIINSGDELRSYKDGETATIGSNRGGVLVSLNRRQLSSIRPIVNVVVICLTAFVFFWAWIERTNYLFVLMPSVHLLLAVRVILSYRGYALPPNLSESYEKALFAWIFVPFAIFLWLYARELTALLDFSSIGVDRDRRILGRAGREAFLGILALPPFWYMLVSLVLMWLVGALSSNLSGIWITLAFFLITLVLAKFLSPVMHGGSREQPLLAWLEQGLGSFSYPGRSFSSRLRAWVMSQPAWDAGLLLGFPIVLAVALRLVGLRTEQLFGFRAELFYQPCLFLGSCRLYLWLFHERFGNIAGDTRWYDYLWLPLPIGIYFLQSWVVGDWGFFLYAVPVLFLALIISWRANRIIPFATLGVLGAVVFLFLGTALFTQSVAALLPDNSTIRYRYLAYQGTGWLQEAALKDVDDAQTPTTQCRAGSSAARRIFGIHEHFWTMFHFAARGADGVGYGGAPIERVPFPDGIAQSDNTYSVYILAEHGGWGGIAILALYMFAGLVMIFILTQHFADDAAPTLLVGGIALTILFSALYHAAGNVGGVPFTGKNLPLLSLNSFSDVILIGLLLALAFSAIGNSCEDLRESSAPMLDSFLGDGTELNKWLAGITLMFVGFLAWVAFSTQKATNNQLYRGDYDLEQFVENTKEYINKGIVEMDERNLRIRLRTDKAPGLAEGQYLRLLINQFNSASPEEKKTGKYFFMARDLYLDEDIYGSELPSDRYRDTVLTVDQNYFKRVSPFATKIVWQGGLRSSDVANDKQGHISGEGISLFLIHKRNLENPIPGLSDETKVQLPNPNRAILADQYTSRRFKVLNDRDEHLFDLYAIEDDAVLEPHANPTSVNGQSVAGKVRLESGDIISVGPSPRTGGRRLTFSYEQGSSGVLAHLRWLNGRRVFTYPQGETFALARPIVEAINTNVGRMSQRGEVDEADRVSKLALTLSINADLNRKLHEKLIEEGEQVWEEVSARRGLPPRLAVTAMDPGTGQVLALASWPSYDPNPRPADQEKADPRSYTNLTRRRDAERYRLFFNHNLTRHVLGSATKPFIASAAASSFPDLLSLSVEDDRDSYNEVLGIPTVPPWRANAMGRVNWDRFLTDSNNLYAVSIGFLGLTQPAARGGLQFTGRALSKPFWLNGQQHAHQPDFGDRLRGGSPEALNLDASPLATKLNELFGIQVSGPDQDPISEVWQQAKQLRLLPERGPLLDFISPEMPNLALNNIRDARQFVMVCLGGKTNLWSNVKSAEAFSRLVTGRRITATVVKADGQPESGLLDSSFASVQPALLRALEGVSRTGTARILAQKIDEINRSRGSREDQRFAIFAKTGTLRDQYRSGRNDSNLILAAGLWNAGAQRLSNGVVLSIFIEKGDRAGEFGRASRFALRLIDILNQRFGWSRAVPVNTEGR